MSSKRFLPSKYVRLVESSDTGSLLMYCSSNFTFLKVGSDLKDRVKALFETQEPIPEEEIPEKLIYLGFFLPEDYDYDTMVTMDYLSLVNSTNVLRISILTTGQCNFRCLYCNEPFVEGKMSEKVQDDIINYIRTILPKYKSLSIDWFGGEPLMALDVIRRMSPKLMEICRAYKKQYTSAMTTNGYYLTKDVLEELLKYRVLHYQITVDGVKEVHDSQRMLANGEGTYDVIMKNFSDIHKYVKSQMFKICVRTNFTKPSLEHLGEYLSELERVLEDDKRFYIDPYIAGDWGGERTEGIKEDLLGTSEENGFVSIIKAFKEQKTTLSVSSFTKLLEPAGSVCLTARKNFYAFSPKGVLHKCSNEFLLNGTSKIGEFENGKIDVDVFEESKWLLQPITELEECRNCFFLPVCLNTMCPRNLYKLRYENSKFTKEDLKKMKFCYQLKDIVDDILLYCEDGNAYIELTENDFKGGICK